MKTVILFSNTSWYLWNFRKGTIKALLDNNYQVICSAPYDDYSLLLTDLGVEYIEAPMDGKSTSILKELRSLLAIFKTIQSKKPDFVFNFTIKMNLYSGLSCRFLGIPYANNVSGLGTAFLHQGISFKLAQIFYGFSNKGAKRVFFQNSEDRSIFLEKNLADETSSELLPGSGINLAHFAESPLPNNSPFTFIMISRLIADKGVREYVAAAGLVKLSYPETRFLLVGPGEVSNKSAIPEEELKQWINEKNIEYVGEQKDVIPWIKQSHVLVLPSYREGMPRTVLEAASMGRPSIVSDVPGCRQSIVADETGWLCEVKNSEDLADVMSMVINMQSDELQKFAKSARLRVEKEFSEDIVIERYMECLFAVMPSNGDTAP